MRRILEAIQDGSFAREWLAENRAGRPNFERAAPGGQGPRDRAGGRQAAGDDAVVGGREEAASGAAGSGQHQHTGRGRGASRPAAPPPRCPADDARTLFEKVWDAHVVQPGARRAGAALRGPAPGARGHLAPGLRGAAAGRPARPPARPHAGHGGPQRPHRRPAPADRRRSCRARQVSHAGAATPASSASSCYDLDSPEQGIVHVIGPELGAHPAGHDHRLRRLAHLHPRRLRRAGLRHRDQRGGARPGDPVHRAVAAPDHGGALHRHARRRVSAPRT